MCFFLYVFLQRRKNTYFQTNLASMSQITVVYQSSLPCWGPILSPTLATDVDWSSCPEGVTYLPISTRKDSSILLAISLSANKYGNGKSLIDDVRINTCIYRALTRIFHCQVWLLKGRSDQQNLRFAFPSPPSPAVCMPARACICKWL